MNEFLLLAVVVVYLAILYGKPTIIESPAPDSIHARPFGYSPDLRPRKRSHCLSLLSVRRHCPENLSFRI